MKKTQTQIIEGKEFLAPEKTFNDAAAAALLDEAGHDRNIIFIGSGEPPARIVDGDLLIDLPSAETQKTGFYNEYAGRITKAFPSIFKKFAKKGAA